MKDSNGEERKHHRKKIVAPVIFALFILLYYIVIVFVCLTVSEIPMIGRIFMVIIPLMLAGVMIAMLRERIKEIRSGEEDDLSKY